MHDRARHLEEVNAIVSAWTSRLTKEEAAEQARRFRIQRAAVRDVSDVMHDPHMHAATCWNGWTIPTWAVSCCR